MGAEEDKHYINMKNLFLLFAVVLCCIGCEKKELDENSDIVYDQYKYLKEYNIKDTVGIEWGSVFIQNTEGGEYLLSGVKQEKLWFGLFDDARNEVQTWTHENIIDESLRMVMVYRVLTFDWGYAIGVVINNSQSSIEELYANPPVGVMFLNKTSNFAFNLTGFYPENFDLQKYASHVVVRNSPHGFGLRQTLINSIFNSKGEKMVDLISDEISEILFGLKDNNRLWVGVYDTESDILEEWSSAESFQRNRRIDLGYGEYKDLAIERVAVGRIIKTDLGYVVAPVYYDNLENRQTIYFGDLFLLNKGSVFVYTSELDSDWYLRVGEIYNWYNGSVVFRERDNFSIISPEGKKLGTLVSFYSGDALKAVSYTDAIVASRGEVYRHDCEKNERLWSVNFSDYITIQSDARLTPKITDKDANTIIYELDIVNRDGSRQNFKCEININTGSVRVL